jgi:putative peptidoglycan lipid II flippase
VNIGCNYTFVFVFKWGHESLALTTSIVASLNFVFLYLAMMRYAGDIGTKGLAMAFAQIGAATFTLGGVCVIGNKLLFANLSGMAIWEKGLWLGVVIGVAGIAYLAVAKLLRVEEMRDFLALVKRKAGR